MHLFWSHMHPKTFQVRLNVFIGCTGVPEIQQVGFIIIFNVAYKDIF